MYGLGKFNNHDYNVRKETTIILDYTNKDGERIIDATIILSGIATSDKFKIRKILLAEFSEKYIRPYVKECTYNVKYLH